MRIRSCPQAASPRCAPRTLAGRLRATPATLPGGCVRARWRSPRGLRGTLGYDGSMKTTRERADERREAKLELMREQVANGSLVIRSMSDEERKQYPPVAARPPRRRS